MHPSVLGALRRERHRIGADHVGSELGDFSYALSCANEKFDDGAVGLVTRGIPDFAEFVIGKDAFAGPMGSLLRAIVTDAPPDAGPGFGEIAVTVGAPT